MLNTHTSLIPDIEIHHSGIFLTYLMAGWNCEYQLKVNNFAPD